MSAGASAAASNAALAGALAAWSAKADASIGFTPAKPPVDEFLLEDREARPAVSRRVLELGIGELVVQRDRDGAGADGAEPGCREIGRVAHQEQHSVSWAHAERRERSRGARDARGEL